jgi:hypothetical protein
MTKYSEAEIILFIKEGYKPRVKTSKGLEYMTLRMGNKEKGLGRVNPYIEDTVWALFEEHKPADPKKESEDAKIINREIHDTFQRIDNLRLFQIAKTCDHVKNGLCTKWRWSLNTWASVTKENQLFEPMANKITDQDGEYYLLRPVGSYCSNCPEYLSKQEAQELL